MSITKNLGINPDMVRIREFEFNKQKLKIKIPNSLEAEQIEERVSNPPQELIQKKYELLANPILDKKDTLKESDDVKILENDIIVGEHSLKELATNQSKTQMRILETFKLLVPIDGQTMEDITYDDIDQEIPLPIQLELVKKIANVISPTYDETKKN